MEGRHNGMVKILKDKELVLVFILFSAQVRTQVVRRQQKFYLSTNFEYYNSVSLPDK
jgi:hypothetical protein